MSPIKMTLSFFVLLNNFIEYEWSLVFAEENATRQVWRYCSSNSVHLYSIAFICKLYRYTGLRQSLNSCRTNKLHCRVTDSGPRTPNTNPSCSQIRDLGPCPFPFLRVIFLWWMGRIWFDCFCTPKSACWCWNESEWDRSQWRSTWIPVWRISTLDHKGSSYSLGPPNLSLWPCPAKLESRQLLKTSLVEKINRSDF